MTAFDDAIQSELRYDELHVRSKDIEKACNEFFEWLSEKGYGAPWSNSIGSYYDPEELLVENKVFIKEIAFFNSTIMVELKAGKDAEIFYWKFIAMARPDEYDYMFPESRVVRFWWD